MLNGRQEKESWPPEGMMVMYVYFTMQWISVAYRFPKIRLWDPNTGKPIGEALKGHTKWITSLSWEPIHLYVYEPALGNLSTDITFVGIQQTLALHHPQKTSLFAFGQRSLAEQNILWADIPPT